jgi:hypothetical protein
MARKQKAKSASSGASIAQEVIARRKLALARRAKIVAARSKGRRLAVPAGAAKGAQTFAAVQAVGHLVAAGDSWFDYPFHDVLTLLDDDYGYHIESSAHAGDAIEAMAYNRGGQLEKLARCFEKVSALGAIPKAVLLSGGGDDIAGDEFGMLLNNANSKIAGWNDEVVDGVINQRIAAAYRSVLDAIAVLSQHYAGNTLPILIHGYDYAVPDGRGLLGGWGPLPGPWLQPGFAEKQFAELSQNTAMVEDIIDRFNAMLQTLTGKPEYQHVRYVDLRGTLSNSLRGDSYKIWWANELHPEKKGFDAVTARFAKVLDGL